MDPSLIELNEQLCMLYKKIKEIKMRDIDEIIKDESIKEHAESNTKASKLINEAYKIAKECILSADKHPQMAPRILLALYNLDQLITPIHSRHRDDGLFISTLLLPDYADKYFNVWLESGKETYDTSEGMF